MCKWQCTDSKLVLHCSFVQHAVNGAAAAVALASWESKGGLLQVSMLHQPLQAALPLEPKPQLCHWQSKQYDLAGVFNSNASGKILSL